MRLEMVTAGTAGAAVMLGLMLTAPAETLGGSNAQAAAPDVQGAQPAPADRPAAAGTEPDGSDPGELAAAAGSAGVPVDGQAASDGGGQNGWIKEIGDRIWARFGAAEATPTTPDQAAGADRKRTGGAAGGGPVRVVFDDGLGEWWEDEGWGFRIRLPRGWTGEAIAGDGGAARSSGYGALTVGRTACAPRAPEVSGEWAARWVLGGTGAEGWSLAGVGRERIGEQGSWWVRTSRGGVTRVHFLLADGAWVWEVRAECAQADWEEVKGVLVRSVRTFEVGESN